QFTTPCTISSPRLYNKCMLCLCSHPFSEYLPSAFVYATIILHNLSQGGSFMHDYQYYKTALEKVNKPCAYLDIDVFNQNIKHIAESNNQKRIRVASKSVRSVGVLKRILDASPVFQG